MTLVPESMKSYYVYIMASHRRILYIGITSKLEKRVREHKQCLSLVVYSPIPSSQTGFL